MSKEITLGLIQMSMSASAKENREKAGRMISEAAKKGAEIVCLPELFTSPYFCVNENPSFEYAEKFDAETNSFLREVAAKENVFLVGGSIHEESAGKYYNTSAVIDNHGKVLGSYRKTHIPHDPCFYEQNYFLPGDTGFKVFQTAKAKISVLICYDQWFPEAARACALAGADIIFYPTAISTVDGVVEEEGNWQEAWENVQRGHAIANNVIVAGVNRVGKEGSSNFWGGSFVCDAFGKTLISGGKEEAVLIQKVDLEHSRKVREGWRFFYNRRPNVYQDITK
ncbi:MAG: acyltransferase [Proteobacteria bacterium]|nr:acyltransferase [Pseudomonadota bacterium]